MPSTLQRPAPSPEAAAALAEARQAAAAVAEIASEGMRIATDLLRQRRENHLHSLVECGVAAVSADPAAQVGEA